MQTSSSSCTCIRRDKLPPWFLLLSAFSSQCGGELCCVLSGRTGARPSPLLLCCTRRRCACAHIYVHTRVHVCVYEQSLTLLTLCLRRVGQGRGKRCLVPTCPHGREGGVLCAGCANDMNYFNLHFCHFQLPGKRRKVKSILNHSLCGVSCLKQSLWQSYSLIAAL